MKSFLRPSSLSSPLLFSLSNARAASHPALLPSLPPSLLPVIGLLQYHTSHTRGLSSYCLGDGRGKVDPRLADVVRYRLSRKEAHSAAVDILEEFLTPPPPAPPAPATINSGEDKEQEEKEDEEEDEDDIEEDDGEQGQIHQQR